MPEHPTLLVLAIISMASAAGGTARKLGKREAKPVSMEIQWKNSNWLLFRFTEH